MMMEAVLIPVLRMIHQEDFRIEPPCLLRHVKKNFRLKNLSYALSISPWLTSLLVLSFFFLSFRVLEDYLDAFVIQHSMWTMKKLSTKANDEPWHAFTFWSTDWWGRVQKNILISIEIFLLSSHEYIYQKGFLLNGGLCSIGDSGASHEFEFVWVMMYLNRSTSLTPLICSDFKVAKCINVEVTVNYKLNNIIIMGYIPI